MMLLKNALICAIIFCALYSSTVKSNLMKSQQILWYPTLPKDGITENGSNITDHNDHVTNHAFPEFNERSRQKRSAQRKFIATTILEEPYMMLKTKSPYLAGNDRFEGFMADILLYLAASLNLDYEIRLAHENIYGSSDESGNWSGMIGELLRGEADIAVGALTVSSDLLKVVDFTVTFMTLKSTALIRKPKTDSVAMTSEPWHIRTSDELYRSRLIYGVEAGSFSHKALERGSSTSEMLRGMWSKIVNTRPSPLTQSTQEGVQRTRYENYAFILDTPAAEYVASREPCDVYTIEPFLSTRSYAFAVRKGATDARNLINAGIYQMLETQELQMLYLKWWADRCTIKRPKPTLAYSVDVATTTRQLPLYPINSHWYRPTNCCPLLTDYWICRINFICWFICLAVFTL